MKNFQNNNSNKIFFQENIENSNKETTDNKKKENIYNKEKENIENYYSENLIPFSEQKITENINIFLKEEKDLKEKGNNNKLREIMKRNNAIISKWIIKIVKEPLHEIKRVLYKEEPITVKICNYYQTLEKILLKFRLYESEEYYKIYFPVIDKKLDSCLSFIDDKISFFHYNKKDKKSEILSIDELISQLINKTDFDEVNRFYENFEYEDSKFDETYLKEYREKYLKKYEKIINIIIMF